MEINDCKPPPPHTALRTSCSGSAPHRSALGLPLAGVSPLDPCDGLSHMPQKSVAPVLTKIVTLRVHPEEYAHISALAVQHGVSFSRFVRGLLCGMKLPPQRLPRVDSEAVQHLAKLGANLNQVAHAFNRWSSVAPDDKREIWLRQRQIIVDLAHQVAALKAELLR